MCELRISLFPGCFGGGGRSSAVKTVIRSSLVNIRSVVLGARNRIQTLVHRVKLYNPGYQLISHVTQKVLAACEDTRCRRNLQASSCVRKQFIAVDTVRDSSIMRAPNVVRRYGDSYMQFFEPADWLQHKYSEK
jgi:hypothetical protein